MPTSEKKAIRDAADLPELLPGYQINYLIISFIYYFPNVLTIGNVQST